MPLVRGRVERRRRGRAAPSARPCPASSATSAAESISVGSKPGIGPARGVHHDERVDAFRVARARLARDHAAHRVAEQPEAVEPGRVGDRERVGDEPVERVRVADRSGLSLAPWPRWSKIDDRVIAGQHGDVVGEVFLGAAEPVHEQQARDRSRPPRPRAPTPSSVVMRMPPCSRESAARRAT